MTLSGVTCGAAPLSALTSEYRALRPARVHGQTGGAGRTVAMEVRLENRGRQTEYCIFDIVELL